MPPFWFYRKLKRSLAEKYPDSRDDSRGNRSHGKTLRIQNRRRNDQTGEFSFRIRPLLCKQHCHSGAKKFGIRGKSGKISSSVNVVLESVGMYTANDLRPNN